MIDGTTAPIVSDEEIARRLASDSDADAASSLDTSDSGSSSSDDEIDETMTSDSKLILNEKTGKSHSA